MTIIDTLMRTVSERRRRGPDEGFRVAVLHPADYFALEKEINEAIARQESWALAALHSARHTKVILLPQGLEVCCSPGLVEGWAVFEDRRGLESMTMVSLTTPRIGTE